MENYKKFYNVHVKSKLDFLLALVFLIVLLPVYIIISLAIIIDSGFPVFIRQIEADIRECLLKFLNFVRW